MQNRENERAEDEENETEGSKKAAVDGGRVQYSIETLDDGRKYVKAERQVLTGTDPEVWGKQIANFINEQIRHGMDIAIPTTDGHILLLTGRSSYKLSDRHVAAIASKVEQFMNDEDFARKGRAAVHIDELIQVARFNGYQADRNNKHENDIGEDGFNYFEAFFLDADESYYKLPLSVALNGAEETAYNIGKPEKRRFPASTGSSSTKGGAQMGRKPSAGIIRTADTKSQENLPCSSPMKKLWQKKPHVSSTVRRTTAFPTGSCCWRRPSGRAPARS